MRKLYILLCLELSVQFWVALLGGLQVLKRLPFPPPFFLACHAKWLSPSLAHFSLHWLRALSGCTALIGWVASRWRDEMGRLSPLKSPAARPRRLPLSLYTGRCTSALIRIRLRFQQLTSVSSPWQQSLFTFSHSKLNLTPSALSVDISRHSRIRLYEQCVS